MTLLIRKVRIEFNWVERSSKRVAVTNLKFQDIRVQYNTYRWDVFFWEQYNFLKDFCVELIPQHVFQS